MTESNDVTKPVVLHNLNFDRVLQDSELPVLFEFWASWCHHCSSISPVVHEVAAEFGGKIIVGQVNCDLNRELCKRYEVTGIPCFFLASQGKVIGSILNPLDKEALVSWIEATLPSSSTVSSPAK